MSLCGSEREARATCKDAWGGYSVHVYAWQHIHMLPCGAERPMSMMASRPGCTGCAPYVISMIIMASRPGYSGCVPYEDGGEHPGVHRMCTLCHGYDYDGE